MTQAVLFDIDGTLIDSVDFHAEAWQRAFAMFGKRVSFDRVRSQIGKGSEELMKEFIGEEEITEWGEDIERFRSALFQREYLRRIRPFAGTRRLFIKIKNDGKRIGLASSAKGDELLHYKRIADIDDLIDEETSSDDADRSKPYPDIFLAAMRRLKVAAAEVVVVGDTPYDAQAALAAGMPAIGVLSGGHSDADLRNAGAAEIYSGIEELLHNYDKTLIRR